MKKFFSDGLDTIVKLIVTQLGMTMFGTMVTFAAYAVPGSITKVDDKITGYGSIFLVVSVFAIIMYLFILYNHIWEKGAKDRIKVDGGRMDKQIFKGLYLSLVANALNILLGLIMCITYYFFDFNGDPSFIAYQLYGSCNSIARIIQGMYNGLLLYISPSASGVSPYMFLVIVLPALLVTTLGYYRGFNNKKLFKTNKK